MDEYIYIKPDYYVGAVKFNGEWRIYYGTLGDWILNYRDYAAPEEDLTNWRNGMDIVDEKNAAEYCGYMSSRAVSLQDVKRLRSQGLVEQAPLTFVVDFDNKTFINGWMDMLPIHVWAPEHWRREKSLPYDYVPESIKALWHEI